MHCMRLCSWGNRWATEREAALHSRMSAGLGLPPGLSPRTLHHVIDMDSEADRSAYSRDPGAPGADMRAFGLPAVAPRGAACAAARQHAAVAASSS
jgi:hypothetical protein